MVEHNDDRIVVELRPDGTADLTMEYPLGEASGELLKAAGNAMINAVMESVKDDPQSVLDTVGVWEGPDDGLTATIVVEPGTDGVRCHPGSRTPKDWLLLQFHIYAATRLIDIGWAVRTAPDAA